MIDRPRFASPATIALTALALALTSCANRAERGAAHPPLEAAPEAPWGRTTIDLRYYELAGTTEEALREEIRSLRVARGMRSYGDTQWQIRTTYDFATSENDCRPTRVDVLLELRVTLPRLRSPGALSDDERADWQRFVRALRSHEAGHKQIAVECAEQVATALAAVPRMRCDALGDAMQSVTEEVTSTCHAHDAEYDLRTRHGAAEGATF
jgi:predicted secreted Zn-dependent protease